MQRVAYVIVLLCYLFDLSAQCVMPDCGDILDTPRVIKRASPIYPLSQAASNNSGMVEIDLMVDERGFTYAPIVVRSTNKFFEDAALRAAENYVYEPVTKDGKPVDSRASIRIFFEIQDVPDTVSARFARLYKRVLNGLDEPNPDEHKLGDTISKMQKARNQTPYALARLNFAKLMYAHKFLELDQQIQAMEVALMFEKRIGLENRALDDSTSEQFHKALFRNYIQTKRYREAVGVHRELVDDSGITTPVFPDIIEKIKQHAVDDIPTVVKFELGERGYALESVFKRTLYFEASAGEIESLKLRCTYHYKELDFKSGAEYKIPDSWGVMQSSGYWFTWNTSRLLSILSFSILNRDRPERISKRAKQGAWERFDALRASSFALPLAVKNRS